MKHKHSTKTILALVAFTLILQIFNECLFCRHHEAGNKSSGFDRQLQYSGGYDSKALGQRVQPIMHRKDSISYKIIRNKFGQSNMA